MSREQDRIRKKLENNPIAECNKIQNRFCSELCTTKVLQVFRACRK